MFLFLSILSLLLCSGKPLISVFFQTYGKRRWHSSHNTLGLCLFVLCYCSYDFREQPCKCWLFFFSFLHDTSHRAKGFHLGGCSLLRMWQGLAEGRRVTLRREFFPSWHGDSKPMLGRLSNSRTSWAYLAGLYLRLFIFSIWKPKLKA